MIRLLILIFILVAGLMFGLSMEAEHGLVLIVYQGKSYEMALWFCGLLLLITFFILHYTVRFLSGFFSLKQWLKEASTHHRLKKSQKKTQQGFIDCANGQWEKAEKNLLAGVQWSESPFVNYLALARAAQEQNALERSDHYLALAKKLGNIDRAKKKLLDDRAFNSNLVHIPLSS